jgi:septum site-determining protein MinC
MDKGYIENGFIVDLSSAKKTSEIIYELSRVLDMPESKDKHICLKLGQVDLNQNELTSIKTLVELMESQLAFISTSSETTLESATALDIKISEFTEQIEAPTFESQEPAPEVSDALDNIFGEGETTTKAVNEEDDISPVIQNNEHIAQQVEQQEIKEESDEEITAKKNEAENLPTLYLRKTIRSGQSISSDGNIVIIGDVNPGAEVIAKGDITVWGILGGIAHAGSEGNNYARIRALKLNPVQIRIGEVFARRPDTVNIPYVQKSSEYIPEEAFTYKGSIVIRKIHEGN